jgi:hypothetical protein
VVGPNVLLKQKTVFRARRNIAVLGSSTIDRQGV